MGENTRQQCKRSSEDRVHARPFTSEEEEDGLSLLPDAILTDILSLLPINSAAATSVLSYRWRHLWTTVNRLQFNALQGSDSTVIDTLAQIFRQVTYQSLRVINLDFSKLSYYPNLDSLSSYFYEISRQNVEEISINTCLISEEEGYSLVPPCLFNSQFLVVLKLEGMFNLQEIPKSLGFQLPNLKKLSLCYIVHIPSWLDTLFRSCPLLEDLTLNVDLSEPQNAPSVTIFAPNLKSIFIHMQIAVFPSVMQCAKIFFDAPKLENLVIYDCTSFYYFLKNPMTLVDATIILRTDIEEHHENDEVRDEGYLRHMSKFVAEMSSVRHLKLMVDIDTDIFPYLNHGDDVFLPIFRDLIHFEAAFNDVGSNDDWKPWKNVLFSLQCFPNLQHLKVDMIGDPPVVQSIWDAPNSVPECLVSKLKTIGIGRVMGTSNELELLAYIMKNAHVLEKLRVRVCIEEIFDLKCVIHKALAVWEECQYLKSLFELPRSSSACEVVVSGGSVAASGNALQNGYLTCLMCMGPST